MMTLSSTSLGAIAAVGALLLAILLVQGWSARKVMAKVRFQEMQLERALAQIKSDKEREIRAGLHVLRQLRHPVYRIKAMQRIDALRGHANPYVAREAKQTYDAIMRDFDRS